jgi:hypothetical protein
MGSFDRQGLVQNQRVGACRHRKRRAAFSGHALGDTHSFRDHAAPRATPLRCAVLRAGLFQIVWLDYGLLGGVTRLRNILVFGAMALLSGRASLAQDSSPGDASPVDASGAIELPEVEVEAVSGNANTSAMQAFQNKMNAMDQSRDNFLLPKFGAPPTIWIARR